MNPQLTLPLEYTKLVKLLTERTKNKTLIWSIYNTQDFKLEFSQSSIVLSMYGDENARGVAQISLCESSGAVADCYTLYEVRDTEFPLLDQLYTEVRKLYYNVDKALQQIFIELQSEETIGRASEPKFYLSEDIPF
jgi:hypothetical protein